MNVGSVFILAVLFSPALVGADWHCRNDMESACTTSGCHVTTGDDFTPVDVWLQENGGMSICMYSGCWEGQGEVLSRAPYLVVMSKQLVWDSPHKSDNAQALISLELASGVAVMQVAGFHEPLLCFPGDE